MKQRARFIAAVFWMQGVWWAHAYLTKDLPPFHWVSFPAFATALTAAFAGAALLIFWDKGRLT